MKKYVSGNARGLLLFVVLVALILASSRGVQSKKSADDYRIQITDSNGYYSTTYEGVLEYYNGDNISEPMKIIMTKQNNKPVTIPYKVMLYTLDAKNIVDISGNSRIEDKEKCLPDEPSRVIRGKLKFDKFRKIHKKYKQLIDFKTSLGKLKPGYYWLAIDFIKARKAITFHISQSGLIAKSTKDEALVFSQDKKTGAALPGMEISISADNDFYKLGLTGEDGVFRFKKSDLSMVPKEKFDPEYFFVKAAKGDDVTICRMRFGINYPPNYIGYIYTDRPIYRPGQTVHFKAVIRKKIGNKLECVPAEEFKVLVSNYETQDKIYEKKLKANEFGNISDSFQLGEKSKLGDFRIFVGKEDRFLANYSFKVEEYRKPEYEITVKPLSKSVVRGDIARFEVDARYYFGKPLADADFTYEFDEQSSYSYKGIERNSLNWLEKYYSNMYEIWAESAVEDKVFHGKTDKNGKAVIEYKTPKEYPQILSVTVKMMDSSRRPVIGTAYTTVAKAGFTVTADTDRKFYTSGSPVNISIKTVDHSGKPVSKKVNLEIVKPLEFKKKDGMKAYRKFVLFKKAIVTDKEGRFNFTYSPKGKTGFFQILASSSDDRGNRILGYREFIRAWKTGNGNYYDWENLITERDTYKVGDRVELLFIKPDSWKNRKNTDIMLTLETDKISKHKIIKVDDATGIISFNAVKDFSPGVDLNLISINNSKFYRTGKIINIDSNQRNLAIKLESDKNKYKPGENATFKIQALKKEDNTPSSCELSLGVADDSVFALTDNANNNIGDFFTDKPMHSDPYRYHFRRYYPPLIDTFSSVMNTGQFRGIRPGFIDPVFGESANYIKIKKTTRVKVDQVETRVVGATKRNDVLLPPVIRQYFPDTCYFNPHIITDEKGEAVVHVRFPDSLTTWRATAVANSKNSEFGQAEEKVTVSKNLLVRLITPRFLVEKDETSVMGIVHNYLDKPVEAQVSLDAEGVEMLSPQTVKVGIKPGDKAVVKWKVRVVKTGEAKFTVKALTTKESDAVLMKIPLLAHGSKFVDAKAGSADDNLTLTFNLSEKASKQSAVLRINLAPSLAGTLMDALKYLADYPYGCVEQTMNQFIPNAVVQASLKELGIRNEKLEKELPDMMKKGFKKIYDYQHKDGGWGWWEGDKTDPMMTALVIYGLSLADKAGYKVDRKKLMNGTFRLKNQLMEVKDPNKRAFILFALSEADVKMDHFVQKLFGKYDKLDNYSQALLAITLYKHNHKEKAKKILRSLEKRATKHKTAVYWKGKGTYSWSDNTVETTAYAVQAFLLIEPENPIIEKAIRYLAISRRGKCWDSTKDTAAAILAVMDYAKKTKEMDPEFEASLYLNGKKLKEIKFTKKDIASGGLTLEIPGEDLKTGENTVTVEKSGRGKAYLTCALTSYLRTAKAKAYANGFSVTRKYYKVVKKTQQEMKAEKKESRKIYGYDGYNRNPSEKLIPMNDKELITLKPQDVVEVSLFIEGRSGLEYIMIEDMKPAGCEFLKDEKDQWRYWYGQREFRDDRAVFFIDRMWKKSQNFRYRLRAETPGTYHVLPANASLMYFPDVSGGSEEFKVKVEGEKRR